MVPVTKIGFAVDKWVENLVCKVCGFSRRLKYEIIIIIDYIFDFGRQGF